MTGWTLGSIKAHRLALEGHCPDPACGEVVTFDLDRLLLSAGPDYRTPEFVPGIDCPGCGGRLKATLAAPPEDDGEANR